MARVSCPRSRGPVGHVPVRMPTQSGGHGTRHEARGGTVRKNSCLTRTQYDLQADELQAFRDLFGGDQLAAAGARADLARPFPVGGGGDVALPERPGAALRRADGVNGAAPVAVVK